MVLVPGLCYTLKKEYKRKKVNNLSFVSDRKKQLEQVKSQEVSRYIYRQKCQMKTLKLI